MNYGKSSKQRIVNYDMGCDCGKHLETEAEKGGCQKSAELEARDQVHVIRRLYHETDFVGN